MACELVRIRTPDGDCPTSVFTPSGGSGPWPGVVFLIDGLGIRPVLSEMGQRLSDVGFVVVQPDLFYRFGPYTPLKPCEVLTSEDPRAVLAPMMSTTDNHRAARDIEPVLTYLQARSDVSGERIGTTGYCMGGAVSLTVAATYPDRVAAAASFHGGGLATDSDLSPHLRVCDITGRVYVAAADNDSSYPPPMAARLVEAMMKSSVHFRHDLYVGASHGWTMTDFPVYDRAAAERHWVEMTGFLSEALQ